MYAMRELEDDFPRYTIKDYTEEVRQDKKEALKEEKRNLRENIKFFSKCFKDLYNVEKQSCILRDIRKKENPEKFLSDAIAENVKNLNLLDLDSDGCYDALLSDLQRLCQD